MRWFACATLVAACSSSSLQHELERGAGGEGSDANDVLALAPGEVAELSLGTDGAFGARLATPNGNEHFVLILGSTRFELADDFRYSLELGVAPSSLTARQVTDCALAPGLGRNTQLIVDPPPTGSAPEAGDRKPIEIPTPSGYLDIEVEAVSIGAHATVWIDTTNGTALDPDFVAAFRDDFENLIMPRERTLFGTEPDIDHDGRVNLIFSPLTYQTAVAFFSGCDLRDASAKCHPKNGGEYLYLTPPGDIEPPYDTPAAMKEILTHEFSHMLHYNRKVYLNGNGAWNDSSYMAEGVGAFAQDAIGFQLGNLYVAQQGLEAIDDFSLSNVLLDGVTYDADRDGVLRGGAYWFVRYLYDRGGGDRVDGAAIINRGGPAFLRALLDPVDSIAVALPEVAKTTWADVAIDFYTTLGLSNREHIGGVAPKNSCFSYLPVMTDPITGNQRGGDVFTSFHGMMMQGPHVSAATAADGSLRPGGVEFLTLDASPTERDVAFALHVDPQAAPRVRVARWQ
jgi:hypothetical protein